LAGELLWVGVKRAARAVSSSVVFWNCEEPIDDYDDDCDED
jgi:hypothetical protein